MREKVGNDQEYAKSKFHVAIFEWLNEGARGLFMSV